MSDPYGDPGPCWCGAGDLCADPACLRVATDHEFHFGHPFDPTFRPLPATHTGGTA